MEIIGLLSLVVVLLMFGIYKMTNKKTNEEVTKKTYKKQVTPNLRVVRSHNGKTYTGKCKLGTDGTSKNDWDYYDETGELILDLILIDFLFDDFFIDEDVDENLSEDVDENVSETTNLDYSTPSYESPSYESPSYSSSSYSSSSSDYGSSSSSSSSDYGSSSSSSSSDSSSYDSGGSYD
tara:strand:+ start:18142 stop:18678 length:537 start_codon:yes stop_codon:yes gene_type:complete